MMEQQNDIQQNKGAVSIQLASPDVIRNWSYGEVTKPETINYRSFKPEKDGLFCEKIFGPVKNYECNCGKYKRIRYKGVICDRCGVEVTEAKERRKRMGHIEMAIPVVHIWFFRGAPNIINLLCKAAYGKTCFTLYGNAAGERGNVESVVYYEHYVVLNPGNTDLAKGQLLTENDYRDFMEEKRDLEVDMGASAIRRLLAEIDLDEVAARLRREIKEQAALNTKADLLKQLQVVQAFSRSSNRPEWMVLDVLPVLPPDLRPLVPLDGGRFATSDLNDLYRRVINRNNRLKKLIQIKAPQVILRNEKRMLQEAVDSLFDNSKRRAGAGRESRHPLKSLSELLKGKSGRFRQNLLGKRVDYSGRSVIVVGPELKMHECGLPKDMALELYRPFVVHRLTEDGYAGTVKSAKRYIDKGYQEVWDILEEILNDHPVLLNRAPTLHRLGIQAFYPRLIEGKAIRLHPLVCAAFNADFDGDQMAVHLPLSFEAQLEARVIMIAPNNILHPASGKPIAVPAQDMVLGLYYLSKIRCNRKPDGNVWPLAEKEDYHRSLHRFYSEDEALQAYNSDADDAWRDYRDTVGQKFRDWTIEEEEPRAYTHRRVSLNKSILVRFAKGRRVYSSEFFRDTKVRSVRTGAESVVKAGSRADMVELLEDTLLETSVGRCIVNSKVPQDVLGFANIEFSKKSISKTIDDLYRLAGNARTVQYLDDIKNLGYYWAGRSGISAGICDMIIPPEKGAMLEKTQKQVDNIFDQYENGVITDGERYNQVVDAWSHITGDISNLLFEQLKGDRDGFNPVFMMADSGARGSREQIKQLSGMRGLMQKPVKQLGGQEVVENPIRSSFREGLNVMEYFISTHGARKGLADTAMKTADAGYLTRRLVDVAQDVVVTMDDCGTTQGKEMRAVKDGDDVVEELGERILGRVAAVDVLHPVSGEVIVKGGDMIDERAVAAIDAAGIESVVVRSVLTCEAPSGVCAQCYGRNLANGRKVDIGEAVGVLAAQSIGEPGTQLTLRTFHIGGASSRLAVDNTRKAPVDGTLSYESVVVVKRDKDGVPVVVSRSGEAVVTDAERIVRGRFPVPYGAELSKFELDDQGTTLRPVAVKKGEALFQWDPYNSVIVTQVAGKVQYDQMVEGRTYHVDYDENTGASTTRVIVDRRGQLRPHVNIVDAAGTRVGSFQLPADGIVVVEDGETIGVGDIVCKLARSATKTRDITGGLPRVAELFEARPPKDPAVISPVSGVVQEGALEHGKQRLFILSEEDMDLWNGMNADQKAAYGAIPDDLRVSKATGAVWMANKLNKDRTVAVEEPAEGAADAEGAGKRKTASGQPRKGVDLVFATSGSALIPKGKHLAVHAGDRVKSGEKLCDGSEDAKDILRVNGPKAVQEFVVTEIQKVYRLQGVVISDKHIECIVRQMMRKVEILDPGETELNEQDEISRLRLRQINERAIAEGRRPAVYRPTIQGITRSSLGTDSFISAAAFQETTKVLTKAAIEGSRDDLVGLKENVTMGRLIPSGTGAPLMRQLRVKDLDAEDAILAQSAQGEEGAEEEEMGAQDM